MAKRKSLEVKTEDYSIIEKKYREGNKKYYELFSGSRKTLLNENNDVVCSSVSSNSLNIGDLDKASFNVFLAQFNKNLYKNLRANNLFDFSVNFSGMSRRKNIKNYQRLNVGDFFYNVDLNSAYWQVAFLLNYIDEKLFLKYKNLSEYKSAKRLCISFLARNHKKTFFSPNGDFFTINCDNSVLKNVYQNIRNFLYSLFQEISLETDWIAYNIDSIYVQKKDLIIVKEFLNALNIEYKLVLCQKINEKQFTFGKQIKKF